MVAAVMEKRNRKVRSVHGAIAIVSRHLATVRQTWDHLRQCLRSFLLLIEPVVVVVCWLCVGCGC